MSPRSSLDFAQLARSRPLRPARAGGAPTSEASRLGVGRHENGALRGAGVWLRLPKKRAAMVAELEAKKPAT